MPRSQTPASADLPTTLVIAMPAAFKEQILLEALEPLAMLLVEHGAAASLNLNPSRITIDMMVRAPAEDPVAALAGVQPAVQGVHAALVDVLGAGHGGQVISVTVQTETAREEALAALDDARDLMGISEIAEMRGQLRQAVQRVAKYPQFPRPVVTLKAGPVYRGRDVRQFYEREEARTSGRGDAQSGGQTPDQPQRARLAELLQELLDQRDPTTSSAREQWRLGAGRPHWLLQPLVLASAIHALGGAKEVAQRVGVQPRQVYRWLAWAESQRRAHTRAPTKAPKESATIPPHEHV